jgi:hypothetical protein
MSIKEMSNYAMKVKQLSVLYADKQELIRKHGHLLDRAVMPKWGNINRKSAGITFTINNMKKSIKDITAKLIPKIEAEKLRIERKKIQKEEAERLRLEKLEEEKEAERIRLAELEHKKNQLIIKKKETERLRIEMLERLSLQRQCRQLLYEYVEEKNQDAHFEYDGKSMDIKQFINIIARELHGYTVSLKIGDITRYMNDITRERMSELIEDGFNGSNTEVKKYISSDAEFMCEIEAQENITVSLFTHKKFINGVKGYNKDNGHFFKYTNNMPFNLDRYGIHKEIIPGNYKDTCLVIALLNGGISETKAELARQMIKCRQVPISKIKELCLALKICIDVKNLNDLTHHSKAIYGKEFKELEIYYVGLIDEHYFIIDKEIQLTRYALEHYDEIKEEKKFNTIYMYNEKKGSLNAPLTGLLIVLRL